MVPTTGSAILVLAVFVLPGFVTLLFRERLFVVRANEPAFDRLLHALFYSALVYAIALTVGALSGLNAADISELYRGHKALAEDLAAGMVVVLLLPGLIATLSALWRRSKSWRPKLLDLLGGSHAHGTSSAWNAFFGEDGTRLIRVTMKDGRVVGGFYGMGSFAAYSEHGGDIYIAQRWVLDEDSWFVKPIDESLGLWISGEQIASLEAYRSASEEKA